MTDDALGTLGLISIGLGAVAVGTALPATVGLVLLLLGGVLWVAGNR